MLVEANGQMVDAEHPISEVIKAGQGAPVSIKVLRDGQPMVFNVTPDQNKGVYQVGIQIGPVRRADAGVARRRRQGGGGLPVLRVGRHPRRASTT